MIHIVHTLGGCGGTLLSRCLGVLPGVAFLSEVNPASVKLFSTFDPLFQDRNWLHLLGPADTERFSQTDLRNPEAFRELVDVFHVRASQAGRHLVLRDYSFVDFVGVPFTAKPPRRFTLYAALPAGVRTRAVALIRHPVDQWSSLCKHELVRPVLTPSVFCEAYAAFLEELGDIPVYKYEDFVEHPSMQLRAICGDLALPFDPLFTERFHTFDYVTGDFTRHHEKSISPPCKRELSPSKLDEFRSSAAFRRILRTTGYAEVDAPKPLCLEASAST
jgi:hypothetical protein